MRNAVLWTVVECACRVLGISTAAVLCAVGVQTLRQGQFYSLAVYLLVSSGGMMLFEASYFVDALLTVCLPCPPQWTVFILWKKMAKLGGFQKFLYYTLMSVVCFLHPVLVWHAVIPGALSPTFTLTEFGAMLLATGSAYFILSKNKKKSSNWLASPPDPYSDASTTVTYTSDTGEAKQAFSVLRPGAGKRTSTLAYVRSPDGSAQAMLEQGSPAPASGNRDKKHVRFEDSPTGAAQTETEMQEYPELDPEETTSDKAPMIRS